MKKTRHHRIFAIFILKINKFYYNLDDFIVKWKVRVLERYGIIRMEVMMDRFMKEIKHRIIWRKKGVSC